MLEWLKEPGFFGTHATVGADMSQLMATFFTGLFVIGWIQAKRHRADAHHWMMFGGMIAMVAFFISYYLFRQLGVLAFEGKEGFGGSQALYDYVFIPVLTVHIILVILGLVMAIYMIVLGFRAQQVDRWCPIAQGDTVAHDVEEDRDDLRYAHGAGHAVVLIAHRHRRFFHAEIRSVSRFAGCHRDRVLGRDDDPTDLAERRAPPSGARAVHDGRLLRPLCDRDHHLHDALSLVSRQDRVSDAMICDE